MNKAMRIKSLDYMYSRKRIIHCPSCENKTLEKTDDGWMCHYSVGASTHHDFEGWECGFTMEMIE